MSIDNPTESASVMAFGMFPWNMLPYVHMVFGPEESATLLKTYGEAGGPTAGPKSGGASGKTAIANSTGFGTGFSPNL